MTYLFRALRFSLRSRLRRPLFWAFFLLLALLALYLRQSAPSVPPAAGATIALVPPDGGAAELSRALRASETAAVTFVEADEASAEREVAAGHWDCALVCAPDFDERLSRGEYDNLFTVVTGPASVLAPLARESAAAALARRVAPDIALDYLRRLGVTDEARLSTAREQIAAGLPDEQLVHVRVQTLRGEDLDASRLTRLGANRLARGCFGAALLVWMLFAAAELIRRRKAPDLRRLAPCLPRALLLLPQLLSFALPACFAGVLCLFAVGEVNARGLLALALYGAALGAAALLLGCVAPEESTLTLLIPFAASACLILSPTLFDVAALLPALAPLARILPLTLYLRAGDGSVAAMLALLATAVVCSLAAAASDRFTRKS